MSGPTIDAMRDPAARADGPGPAGATPMIVGMQVIPVAGGHKLTIDSTMHIAATLTATTTKQTQESQR